MNKIYKHILTAGVVISALGTASSQNTLTLEQCRSQAIEYNKELKVSAYKKKEAEAYQKVARTAYLPAIGADVSLIHRPQDIAMGIDGGFLPTANSEADAQAGNWSGVSDVYSPGMSFELDNLTYISGGVSVTQPVFAGGKIYYSNKKADVGVEMSEFGYQLKYSEVIELTDRTFWQVAMVEANIELAESYIVMLTELEEQMTDMYNLGITPASEKLKVSVQKNEAELTLLKARNGLKISKMYLNQVIGRDLQAEVNINYDELTIGVFDMSSGVESAMNNRSELKLMQKQVEMSEYDGKITRADYLPSAGVSLQYSTLYLNDVYDDMDFQPIISGSVTIPLFKWGQGAQKQKAAELATLQAQEDLSRTNDLVTLEVLQVQVQVEESFEAIEIAEKSVKEATESLDETKASFEVGLNTTTELLNAQADLQKAKAQLISAKAEHKVLETSWQKAIGMLGSVQ